MRLKFSGYISRQAYLHFYIWTWRDEEAFIVQTNNLREVKS